MQKPKTGSKMEIDIQGIAIRGEGVYRQNDFTFYIPRALPGDRVSITIKRINKFTIEAAMDKIVKQSSSRIGSQCDWFGRGCGGCQVLDYEYGEQCRWKNATIRDALRKIGVRSEQIEPIVEMKKPYLGRNKLSLARDDIGKLGMCIEHTSNVIVIDSCIQEMKPNMTAYDILRDMRLPESITQIHIRATRDNKIGISLFAKDVLGKLHQCAVTMMKKIPNLIGVGAAGYRDYKHLAGDEFLVEKISGVTYLIPLGGFFQTNYLQAGRLLEAAFEKSNVPLSGRVLDLYSGSGFFALKSAIRASEVIAIENNQLSHIAAIKSAEKNGIKNIRFIKSDASQAIMSIKRGGIDAAIVDPPRMGCDRRVLDTLLRIKPASIVYISCSPQVMVTDLGRLIDGGYAVKSCHPIDMFPHTYHIETVVHLVRKA
jgi:23S rRNA (uracil1939-C5)-methyltransferase